MEAITGYFIVGVIVVIAVYDVVAWFKGGQKATISKAIIDYSHKVIAVPFAFGFIMGHLFWPLAKNDEAALKECERIKIEREVKEKLEEKE